MNKKRSEQFRKNWVNFERKENGSDKEEKDRDMMKRELKKNWKGSFKFQKIDPN